MVNSRERLRFGTRPRGLVVAHSRVAAINRVSVVAGLSGVSLFTERGSFMRWQRPVLENPCICSSSVCHFFKRL